MKCSSCDTENSIKYKYCENCGETLPAHCHDCGAVPGVHKNFCESCGEPMQSLARNTTAQKVTPKPSEVNQITTTDSGSATQTRTKVLNSALEDCDQRTSSAASNKGESSKPFDLSLFEVNGDKRCYVRGNIPEDLIRNAISAYAPDTNHNEVLVLADDTIRGNGKLGFLLTNNVLYCKNDFVDPVRLELKDIASISVKKGFLNTSIIANGKEVLVKGMLEPSTMNCLAASIAKHNKI